VSTPAPFLSRHLGDYLLVAQLSEDPLGTVFRALYAADERRFVRLRVLQSEELAAEAMLRTVRENRLRDVVLEHDAIVVRPELEVVDGIPFMTWDETAGWTLDTMLARVRSFGIRIPAEYALLIVERIAAALEHAHQTMVDGRPLAHGLLWPGFVSISHDAVVRVGGFGVADGILPSLGGPRMTADIAPYVAPEERHDLKFSGPSDVYSLGAILMELMTGRRPSLETPSTELRAGDPRSDELSAFLRRCLAEPAERFPSAVEAHRALQQMVTGNPFSLFTANLALFLYKLLNPESQSVAPSSDWESTSPVVVETKTRRGESTASSTAKRASSTTGTATGIATSTGTAPRRRRGDLDATEESVLEPAVIRKAEAASPEVPSDVDRSPAPAAIQAHALELISAKTSPASGAPPWKRQALLLAAAAGVAAGAFLVAGHMDTRTVSVAPPPPDASARAALPAPEPTPVEVSPPPVAAPPAVAAARSVPLQARPAAVRPVARKTQPELRQPAEDLRYKAAIARIEADRLSAREKAPDVFREGERSENDGIRFLRERDYDAAQGAFSRAAHLFEQARERSWEERVRGTSLGESRD